MNVGDTLICKKNWYHHIVTDTILFEKDKEYKVIFDVFTDNSKEGAVNPLINTVARYLNMHAQQGIKLENMNVNQM